MALALSFAAYCADFWFQYDVLPLTVYLGSAASRSRICLLSAASSILPLTGV